MTDATSQTDPLALLGAHLGAHGFKVELTVRGLKVTNPQVAGCCDEVPHVADTITCRPRRDDGGRIWFFTSWREPIAEADRVVEAKMVILRRLAGRSEVTEVGR